MYLPGQLPFLCWRDEADFYRTSPEEIYGKKDEVFMKFWTGLLTVVVVVMLLGMVMKFDAINQAEKTMKAEIAAYRATVEAFGSQIDSRAKKHVKTLNTEFNTFKKESLATDSDISKSLKQTITLAQGNEKDLSSVAGKVQAFEKDVAGISVEVFKDVKLLKTQAYLVSPVVTTPAGGSVEVSRTRFIPVVIEHGTGRVRVLTVEKDGQTQIQW